MPCPPQKQSGAERLTAFEELADYRQGDDGDYLIPDEEWEAMQRTSLGRAGAKIKSMHVSQQLPGDHVTEFGTILHTFEFQDHPYDDLASTIQEELGAGGQLMNRRWVSSIWGRE